MSVSDKSGAFGMSSPSRGTWIEMLPRSITIILHRSSPSRGTWIEITAKGYLDKFLTSSPSRGTWIEIVPLSLTILYSPVVPLTGDVD